ncbi:MAG: hypothetical protein ACN4GW_02835 [Desulforhopalus sp.]
MSEKKNPNGAEQKDIKKESKTLSRRKAVKTIAGGVGALAAYHTLPVNWSKPVIEQIFLPAHAQTSGVDVPVDPSIPVTPGHPDHPDYPLAPSHPDHPHNNPSAVINSVTSNVVSGLPGFIEVLVGMTLNRIAQYTFVVTNTSIPASQPNSSDTKMYINQTIPNTLSLDFAIAGAVGDTVEVTITNNVDSEVITQQSVVQGTVSLSCSGTPACGSQVVSGQSVNVTVTVTPNPGAGRQIAIEEFCGSVSTGTGSSLLTNASGQIAVFGAVPSAACPGDPSFALSFSYSGASCKCEWFIT